MVSKVVYIEDEPLNMALIRKMFKTMDFDLIEVRNGSEAMTVISREMPDVILLDVYLAEISGLDIARDVKNQPELAHIPIIAFTADPSIYMECQEAGCDGYLNKPISRNVLLRTLYQFLPTQ